MKYKTGDRVMVNPAWLDGEAHHGITPESLEKCRGKVGTVEDCTGGPVYNVKFPHDWWFFKEDGLMPANVSGLVVSRLTEWLRSHLPHDKQQAFIAGVVVGMAIVAALVLLSGCGGNTTEPHPPTCWPVVVIDSVEYCGGEE